MNGHSIISPSSAERWVNCPGSVKMTEFYPEPVDDSPEADEGTQAHNLAEQIIGRFLGLNTETVSYPNDKDMVDAVMLYVADITNAVGPIQPQDSFAIEEYVKAATVHALSEGTLDFRFIRGTTCIIWDFKYGFKTVEAYENWQGLNYAIALREKFPHLEHFEIRIIQPRSPHEGGQVRTWRFPASRLDRATQLLANAAHAALGPDVPPLLAGNHCRYCPARHGCQALADEAALYVDTVHTAKQFDLNEQSLARELVMLTEAAEMIKFRKTSLEAQAEAHLKAGKLLSGWHLKPTAGHLAWTVPVEQVIEFGRLAGIDLKKPAAVITPTQAKKEGIPKETINQLAKRPAGSLKLEQDNIKSIKQKLGK